MVYKQTNILVNYSGFTRPSRNSRTDGEFVFVWLECQVLIGKRPVAVVYGTKVVAKRKHEKNSGGIGTADLGDIGAVLY